MNRDLQLAWLERQKKKIESLKKDLKAIDDSPYFGNDWYQDRPKIKDVAFDITVSKPKLHWYSHHYEKTIEVKLSNPVTIDTIKKVLEKELEKEETLYNNCKDEDFQEKNCFDYDEWCKDERSFHPGCKNCGSAHCCELHFDLDRKIKEEILKRSNVLK